MAISLELKPELWEKFEKLSGKNQGLIEVVEKLREFLKSDPEGKELIAKYKGEQKAKDQQAPKRKGAPPPKSSKPKSQTPAKDPQKGERKP